MNGLDRADEWYMYQPQIVLETDEIKVLWDSNSATILLLWGRRIEFVK